MTRLCKALESEVLVDCRLGRGVEVENFPYILLLQNDYKILAFKMNTVHNPIPRRTPAAYPGAFSPQCDRLCS